MPTEREAVERERAAVEKAVDAVFETFRLDHCHRLSDTWEGSRALAARLYPRPKVTRPRVVRDSGPTALEYLEWRCVNGNLEFRHNGIVDGPWRDSSLGAWTPSLAQRLEAK